jgi:sulfite exporter TauE/SafE
LEQFQLSPIIAAFIPPYIIIGAILALVGENRSPPLQFGVYTVAAIIAIFMAIILGIIIGKNLNAQQPVRGVE